MAMILTGCVNTTVIDRGCSWTRIITVSHQDQLTAETAGEIEAHNLAREKVCKG